jgi:hypothetical protein
MDFFQPDKRKIGITVSLIIILLAGLTFSKEFDSDQSDDYTRDAGLFMIILLPLTLISGVYNSLSCGNFMDCGMNSQEMSDMIGIFSFILELLYLYTIACAIVTLIDKSKKKSSDKQNI